LANKSTFTKKIQYEVQHEQFGLDEPEAETVADEAPAARVDYPLGVEREFEPREFQALS
jgi:hypothetical protein